MIGRRLVRWRCSVRLPWRLARRRAALLAGAPASQRMQDEQFRRICGRALPFALCVGRARGLCVLPRRFFCADGMGTACSRVLVPPGLRRRRPPRRRPAVRVRGRAAAGRRVEVWQLPRPLAVWPSSVWSAWPLAALLRAASMRVHAAVSRPPGAPAARLRALALAVSRRLALRRLVWCVLASAPAVFFSPLTTPLFSPWRWRAAMRKISVRWAKNSCAPARLKTGGLVAGMARALAAFAAAVAGRLSSRPMAVRAPLAAPCAPSAPFGARRPRRLVVRFGR